MISLLDLPSLRERVHPMPVEAYRRLGEMGVLSDDVELLRGLVVTKTPKSPWHEFVAQMLMNLLVRLVPAGFEVRCERPLTSAAVTGWDRNQSVGWPRTTERSGSEVPMVIEVAITSTELDEGKADIYAEAGIPEYWIVQPESRSVTLYRDPSPAGYGSKALFSTGETLHPIAFPGLAVPVASILPPAGADVRQVVKS